MVAIRNFIILIIDYLISGGSHMKRRSIDLNSISRIIVALIISSVFFYLMYGISRFSDVNASKEARNVEKIINRALMQCYALEGRYPTESSFQEKLEKCGIIFNEEKYLYFYEPSEISNIKPDVKVVEWSK